MAFNINRFVRQTTAYNAGQITTTFNPSSTPALSNGPAWFTYASSADAIATIAAANYFADVVYDLSVNDRIDITGSDASGLYIVSAVDRDAGTVSLTSYSASAVVGTANIQDGAVTNAKVNAAAAIDFSKLATLTSGNILVGSAGNVATSVTMSGDATIVAAGTLTIANNAVTSAKISPLIRKYVTVAISAADFNGMYATPKQLVAAAGANTLIVLDQLQLVMTYGTAAFASGGTAAVQYDSTANGAGVIASTTLADTAFQATASTTFTMNAGVVALPFATTVNKGLYLSNITGAFTTGDSTMVAHIWYRVIPTV